jgi:hypothetical protein
MTDVNTGPAMVAQAEAELAAAEQHLAAAEAAQPPAPPAAQPAVAAPAGTTVHLAANAGPWHQFDPGDGLPVITWAGTDVDGMVAEQIEAAAAKVGFPLRKD